MLNIKKSMPAQLHITDEDQRLVAGWATVEIVDTQGDLVPVDVMEKSMYKYVDRGGHIIYRHSNVPVGKIVHWQVKTHPETGTPGIYIVAKIFNNYDTDKKVWEMIKTGQIKGFSIGGLGKEEKKVMKTDDGEEVEVNVIKDVELMEISLVEEPANPKAVIEAINYFAKGQQINKDCKDRYMEDEHHFKEMTCPDNPDNSSRFCGCVRYMMTCQNRSLESAKKLCAYIYHQKYGKSADTEMEKEKYPRIFNTVAYEMFGRKFAELDETEKLKVLETVDDYVREWQKYFLDKIQEQVEEEAGINEEWEEKEKKDIIIQKPFAGFEDFDDCLRHMREQYRHRYSGEKLEDVARRVCGKLYWEYEGKKKEFMNSIGINNDVDKRYKKIVEKVYEKMFRNALENVLKEVEVEKYNSNELLIGKNGDEEMGKKKIDKQGEVDSSILWNPDGELRTEDGLDEYGRIYYNGELVASIIERSYIDWDEEEERKVEYQYYYIYFYPDVDENKEKGVDGKAFGPYTYYFEAKNKAKEIYGDEIEVRYFKGKMKEKYNISREYKDKETEYSKGEENMSEVPKPDLPKPTEEKKPEAPKPTETKPPEQKPAPKPETKPPEEKKPEFDPKELIQAVKDLKETLAQVKQLLAEVKGQKVTAQEAEKGVKEAVTGKGIEEVGKEDEVMKLKEMNRRLVKRILELKKQINGDNKPVVKKAKPVITKEKVVKKTVTAPRPATIENETTGGVDPTEPIRKLLKGEASLSDVLKELRKQ